MHHHRAVLDESEAAGAGVLREPPRATDRCLTVAPVGAEAAAAVTAPEASHRVAPDVGGVGHDAGAARAWRGPPAAREIAAAEVDVHPAAGVPRLADLHHAATECPGLLLPVARGGGQRDPATAGLDRRSHGQLGAGGGQPAPAA